MLGVGLKFKGFFNISRRTIHEWVSASSKDMHTHVALRNCIEDLKFQLGGEKPHLLTAFFGDDHLPYGSSIAQELSDTFNPKVSFILK